MSSIGQGVQTFQNSITSTGTQSIGAINGSVNGLFVTASIQNPGTTVARMFATIGIVSGGTISETLAVVGLGLAASGSFTGLAATVSDLDIAANGTLSVVNTVSNIGSMSGQMWINVYSSSN